jgi:hypothetical protein
MTFAQKQKNIIDLGIVPNIELNFSPRGIDRASCQNDTVYYTWFKNIGNGGNDFGLAQSAISSSSNDDQRVAQKFEAPQNLNLHGFSFFAGSLSATEVTAAVYSVGADGFPENLLGSTVVSIPASANFALHYASFSSAISITSDYFLVLDNEQNSTPVVLLTTNPETNSGRGEDLSATYYITDWMLYSDEDNWGLDIDFLIFPIVEFNTTVDFTYAPTNPSPGESVTLTNTSSPIFGSRFYNYNAFRKHFNNVADSSFAWRINGALTYSKDASFTNASAGSFDIKLYGINIGSTTVCIDSVSKQISFSSVSVASINDEFKTIVFPNPSNGIINVKTSSTNSTIEIFNTLGAVVARVDSNGNNTVKVDLAGQPKGVYFVKVNENGNTSVSKVSIN